MLKIAITGNIASGKSAFENFIKENGFKVLCLDAVVRNLYENNFEVRSEISKSFGTLDRKEIAKEIFSNLSKKKQLEAIIHPKLFSEMDNFFELNKDDELLFVSAAILFEVGFDKFFDKIILVCADENIRLKRLMNRNSLTQEEASLRIKSQIPDSDKFCKANFIVENNSDLDILKSKADDIVKTLLQK